MSKSFLQFFSDPAPAIKAKFRKSNDDYETVQLRHKLGERADAKGCNYLSSLGSDANLREFQEFYQHHDGAEICIAHNARLGKAQPLIALQRLAEITEFTKEYLPGGNRAWVIDLGKSKAIYRSSAAWIAFAEIDGGPSCLTLFLNEQNAGSVYYLTPQPRFNILRPISKQFGPFLDRIGKDLPAFLRLVRASITFRGSDGSNYGFGAFEYLPNHPIGVSHPLEITPPK